MSRSSFRDRWTGPAAVAVVALSVALAVVVPLPGAATAEPTVGATLQNDGDGENAIRYAPTRPVAGEPVTLVALLAAAEGAEYHWEVRGEELRGRAVEHTFEEPGEIVVRLRVVAGEETVRTVETRIDVAHGEDAASETGTGTADVGFRHVPPAPVTGERVTFVAEGVGGGSEPRWDFDGDGEPETRGRVARHTFEEAETASVTLTTGGRETVARKLTVQPTLQGFPGAVSTEQLDCRATRLCRLPGVGWLLGNERVLVHVEGDRTSERFLDRVEEVSGDAPNASTAPGITYFLRVESGTVTEFDVVEESAGRDPTVNVYTDEATVRRVYGSDDPGEALARAYEEGAVRVRGVGFVNRLKLGVLTTVKGVVHAVSNLL